MKTLPTLIAASWLVVAAGAAPVAAGSGDGSTPIYQVTLVKRTVPAINYRQPRHDTKIDFRGTPLMPAAEGRAEVQLRGGSLDIDLELKHLGPASKFGPGYLTYVLWAITPEGRPTNMGEIFADDDQARLKASTELQSFGMIVTAEPHFAVAQPSDVVVLENLVRSDTSGRVETIEARAELLSRQNLIPDRGLDLAAAGTYPGSRPANDLAQARTALWIARRFNADKLAPEEVKKADALLADAAARFAAKKGDTGVSMSARQAVQTAEDARAIAVKRAEEDRLAAERQRASAEVASAEAKAETEASLRQDAERSRAAAEQSAAEADRLRLQAENEKRELRARLVEQLSVILETRETARGLIISLSDVLFDFGQATLRPGAREKVAKVAGILLAHPGLELIVEGHTDSVGGDDYNQSLSERRAGAVREYLVAQGIGASAIAAQGFGEAMPVATNDTPEGRQQNRRVELVVSGEVLGVEMSSLVKGGR